MIQTGTVRHFSVSCLCITDIWFDISVIWSCLLTFTMTNRTDRVFTFTSPRPGFSSSHTVLHWRTVCSNVTISGLTGIVAVSGKRLYHYIANVYGLTNTNP